MQTRHIWQNKRKKHRPMCYFVLFFLIFQRKRRSILRYDLQVYNILWQSDCAKQNIFNAKELTRQQALDIVYLLHHSSIHSIVPLRQHPTSKIQACWHRTLGISYAWTRILPQRRHGLSLVKTFTNVRYVLSWFEFLIGTTLTVPCQCKILWRLQFLTYFVCTRGMQTILCQIGRCQH